MINHENAKFGKHEIFLFFRVFACPVKPFFLFKRGAFVTKKFFHNMQRIHNEDSKSIMHFNFT
jgi:hypothetical protein